MVTVEELAAEGGVLDVASSTLFINSRRATFRDSRQASPFASLFTLSIQEKANSSSSVAALNSSKAQDSVAPRESTLTR